MHAPANILAGVRMQVGGREKQFAPLVISKLEVLKVHVYVTLTLCSSLSMPHLVISNSTKKINRITIYTIHRMDTPMAYIQQHYSSMP